MPTCLLDPVADLVVVADRVVGLLLGVVAARVLQQVRVEDLLLRVGVDVEVQRERRPDRRQLLRRRRVVQPGEPDPEPVVVFKDQRGDVIHDKHARAECRSTPPDRLEPAP